MGFAVLSAKVNEYFRLFHCDISVTHRLAQFFDFLLIVFVVS